MTNKQNRQVISFRQSDYDAIRQAAIKAGYPVSAGSTSQLSRFVVDALLNPNRLSAQGDEQAEQEQPNA